MSDCCASEPDFLDPFLLLSEQLTGFTRVELEGTGMTHTYYDKVRSIVQTEVFGGMLLEVEKIHRDGAAVSDPAYAEMEFAKRIMDSPAYGPIAINLNLLWYTGQWNPLPQTWRNEYGTSAKDQAEILSPESYREGLMWKAIGAHPMGAKQQGYGSWSRVPPTPPA